jgi:hypothetical protein
MADVTRRHKLVRKANGLQDFQRAGLNASGTGVMGRPVVLIDNPAGNAMAIQLSRHEQAHRTCAHNQYLGVSSHQVSSRSCQLCTPSLCLKSGRIQAAKRLLGNFPQAFSHIALINTAHNLERVEKPCEQRSGNKSLAEAAEVKVR